MTGIMLSDYLVIRRRKLKIEDLYVGDKSSIYWYRNGFHWRAILAFVIGAWPFCPGFIMSLIDAKTSNNWTKLFNISFLVGISIGFIAFTVICIISPPPGKDEGLNYLVSPIVTAQLTLQDDERFSNSVGRPVDPEDEDGKANEAKANHTVSVLTV